MDMYLFPDVSRSGACQLETRANRLEVKRQFYVAMSRAKETLVVCSPASYLNADLPRPKSIM